MKKCLNIILIILFLMAFESNCYAIGRRFIGGCSSNSCGAPVHHAIVQEVVPVVPVFAYPILFPAYQFQYVPVTYGVATAVPVVPITGYPVATPIVQPVASYGQSYVQPQYPSQPQPQYPSQPQPQYPSQPQPQYPSQPNVNMSPTSVGNNGNRDRIRELAKALLEEMAKQNESDNGPPAIPGVAPQPPSNLGVAPQQPQPPPNISQNSQLTAQIAITALNRACYSCHTGVGSRKDTVIFSQPGLLNQNANWRAIRKEIKDGRMPPKDHQIKLSPQERSAIFEWLSANGVND